MSRKSNAQRIAEALKEPIAILVQGLPYMPDDKPSIVCFASMADYQSFCINAPKTFLNINYFRIRRYEAYSFIKFGLAYSINCVYCFTGKEHNEKEFARDLKRSQINYAELKKRLPLKDVCMNYQFGDEPHQVKGHRYY